MADEPEFEYLKWRNVALLFLLTIFCLFLLIFFSIIIIYGLIWWIFVITLTILTAICFLITIIFFEFVWIFKKFDKLPEDPPDKEVEEQLDHTILLKYIIKMFFLNSNEGDLKKISATKISLNSSGLVLYNGNNRNLKSISWHEIKKIKRVNKNSALKWYYTIKLINDKEVWINYQAGKRDGIKIWKIMRAYVKNSNKRHSFLENEFHGDVDFIYFERSKVEDNEV